LVKRARISAIIPLLRGSRWVTTMKLIVVLGRSARKKSSSGSRLPAEPPMPTT